jgi:hypothetical protein
MTKTKAFAAVIPNFLILLGLTLLAATTAELSTRQGSPLIEYAFNSSQCTGASQFTSWNGKHVGASAPVIEMEPSVTSCRGSAGGVQTIGVTSISNSSTAGPRLRTTGGLTNFTDLLNDSGATGLSFEFWIEPSRETASTTRTLFTIGKDDFDELWTRNSCTQASDTVGYFDLQIVQKYY